MYQQQQEGYKNTQEVVTSVGLTIKNNCRNLMIGLETENAVRLLTMSQTTCSAMVFLEKKYHSPSSFKCLFAFPEETEMTSEPDLPEIIGGL